MQQYYLERTLQAVITVVSVMTLAFFLLRLMPGNPADAYRAELIQNNPQLSQADIDHRVEQKLNVLPDAPLHEQYINYVAGLLQGDLGESINEGVPVSEIISEALPWTIFTMSLALLLSFAIGISFGAIMAYKEGSYFDNGLSVLSIFCNSIPNYIVGILSIWFLGYQLELFPTGGRYSTEMEPTVGLLEPIQTLAFLGDALWHASLLILSYTVVAAGGWALRMRGNSIQVLGEEYLRVARLRGLSERRIATRYVGRNAVLPLYTALLIAIGFALGGSVILEQVFTYPGVGYYMIEGLEARDYPLMMGVFLVMTVAVVLGVYIADLTYGLIDPRAQTRGGDHR
ncbi:ABC transporter permease [Natrialba asiatica]|uniref:ABC transporter integral membrane subunit n=1 Tax=Natrialba asiatica (strain ATCC 700177 / DSM 12278 / JCM 9576 / FERM P-10747 / NBRC 102637 / 172P1) TaxID=29540 RepID=M0B425_NATA1|nr:ABC transporter permease [Natrialba asiatica]ELZ05540.1 ABC transporter integral membrane subunit [Natrialba asiatica DSM 12278]